MKDKAKIVLNSLIAVLRSFTTSDVVSVIKNAVVEAFARDDWGDGEKTAYVFQVARAVVRETPSQFDDFVVEALAFLYVKKRGFKF